MLAVAQPAAAQVSFVKCTYTFFYTDTHEQAAPPAEDYYGMEGQSIYLWTPESGLVPACQSLAYISFGPGTFCRERVTNGMLSVEMGAGTEVDLRIAIERLSGRFSYLYGTMTGTGTCVRAEDPRTAQGVI